MSLVFFCSALSLALSLTGSLLLVERLVAEDGAVLLLVEGAGVTSGSAVGVAFSPLEGAGVTSGFLAVALFPLLVEGTGVTSGFLLGALFVVPVEGTGVTSGFLSGFLLISPVEGPGVTSGFLCWLGVSAGIL